ncbi:ArsB/NhaD family transporter [Humisphaera borealis]|uniref:Anion permease n=1 Tax=Humisphaera borealis TaxID=2807512 RepID=A0A7M2WTF8_9BACT|nr:SLC13 family permease [Humisphaera borealis]QOV88756.1 anion permease [Humisphaera borealis]
MKKVIQFGALLAGTVLVLLLCSKTGFLEFNAQQIQSVAIFSCFIYGTLLFGEFRLAFAFAGIALLLGLDLVTVQGFTEAANLKVIIFLIGMFLVIGYLEENQFFEHIVAWIVARVGPRPKSLLLVLMIMATVSAALVDEVTSILFMTGTMLHLTTKYKLKPAPFIIMLVFATNIGSAASSIGNPIGVMIALNAGFSFVEFLRWSAPIALVVNVATYLICRWWYADAFKAFADAVQAEHEALQAKKAARLAASAALVSGGGALAMSGGGSASGPVDPEEFIDDEAFAEDVEPSFDHDPEALRQLQISWLVFGLTILGLVTHGLTEKLLHIKEGSMLIGVSLAMGSVVLFLRREKARELVERRVDWWTLSFFMMLFASVGTLQHTGVTKVIADRLIESTGGNQLLLINIVGWATGWLSAFLDNVLAVATFMPVVHDVRLSWASGNPGATGYPEAIYWMMLFGGTFMGNMTVIGSTANIIAVGVLEKRGHGTIRFGEWFKIGFIVSIVSMAIATVLLGVQTHWFTTPLLPPPTSGPSVSH